jgi:hypothetical protein
VSVTGFAKARLFQWYRPDVRTPIKKAGDTPLCHMKVFDTT